MRRDLSVLVALGLLGCGTESVQGGETDGAAASTEAGESGPATRTEDAGDSSSEGSGASTVSEGGSESAASSTESSTTSATTASLDDGAETAGDTDGDTGEVVEDPCPESTCFVAMGDAGTGEERQHQVARALELVCEDRGCEFVLYLGDNFYTEGVGAVDDDQFQTKFEEPYADVDVPFYVTMGNHDYGNANDWYRLEYQVEYTAYSSKWNMLGSTYAFEVGDAAFYSIDTTRMMWYQEVASQKRWLSGARDASTQPWNFVFAHHPYVSNGEHGNAGNYDGLGWLGIGDGGEIEGFVEDEICGRFDAYFTGHDHNRQWHEPQCGTQFIVSGAGAKTQDFAHRDNNTVLYEDDQKAGFLWVELRGDTFTGIFFDEDGNADFEHSFTRTP